MEAQKKPKRINSFPICALKHPVTRLAMRDTNTPSLGAATTAASTKPGRIENKTNAVYVIHMPSTVLLQCDNTGERREISTG